MTEAERLVADIVGVTGELVDERRLAIAQTYLDTWRRKIEYLDALVDRQALHVTHLVMKQRGHDWFAEILVLREQLELALKMRDAAREASARDLEARRAAQDEEARMRHILDGIRRNAPACGACAEQLFCGSAMHAHTCAISALAVAEAEVVHLQSVIDAWRKS